MKPSLAGEIVCAVAILGLPFWLLWACRP